MTKVWQVLVQWQGVPTEEATWEDYDEMVEHFPDFSLEDKGILEERGNVETVRKSKRIMERRPQNGKVTQRQGCLNFKEERGLKPRFLEEIKSSKKGIELEDGWKSSGGNEDRKKESLAFQSGEISANWPGNTVVNNTTLQNGLKKWKGRDSSVSVKRLNMKTKYSNVNFKVSWNLEGGFLRLLRPVRNWVLISKERK
ncbi:hypothetical protein LWI29_007494 [Acer saccharum]|uniref:Chromo domain-containing protein n=1 Tax=Acer saccharum TaxID=4024 RepID=A0AA39TJI4_ACESA|nr:hypothetical protein LWI29_007494 [Acer saccharum]